MESSEYRTSSFCSGAQCVEVDARRPAVRVRDTKDRTRPAIAFPATEWAEFVAEVKRGGFR